MRLWIISVALFIFSKTNADDSTDRGHLTYDPGDKYSELLSPRLSSYGQILAGDQPNLDAHAGRTQIRFDDTPPKKAVKFEDSEEEYRPLDNLTVDADEHIPSPVKFENGPDKNSKTKIKFEDNEDGLNAIDYQDNGDEIHSENGVVQDDSVIMDNFERGQITAENDSESESVDGKRRDSDRNVVAEPIVFEVQSSDKKPVRIEKPPSRRKPRLKTPEENSPYLPSNSLYPGPAHPSRPGVRYPGHQNPGNPTPGYSGYPNGYPYSGYGYPHYPGVYPGSVYPTPIYSGWPYPLVNQGYGLYPLAGLRPGERRPPVNQGQKYPNQELAGSSNPPTPLNGKPVPPGSLYPYNQGSSVPGYVQGYPGGQYPLYGHYAPAYPGRPVPSGQYPGTRRPKSLTERAVSAVAEALTSIALYDDQQCVPRLLCEVASGSSVASSPLLKYTAGLQPLLTLLQAYNGVSTSPLYVFARAAVLGMTAKGNPTNCFQSYPQCPRDPVQLVNYLNNHNGGFFRFFGQPASQQPQNLDQFYNYLTGNQIKPQNNKNLGAYSYGLLNTNIPTYQNNYGYQNSYRNANDEADTKIEERIQNKPAVNALGEQYDQNTDAEDNGSKWLFPDEKAADTQADKNRNKLRERDPATVVHQAHRPQRASKTLKFPDDINNFNGDINKEDREDFRKLKNTFFPGDKYLQFSTNYQTTTPVNTADYVFDHKYNFYVKRPKAVRNDDVVYIVRGNGDPNYPEIVKLRPGQSLR